MSKLLEVKDLKTSFKTHIGDVQSVRGVSFHLEKGEALGVVGESGCGKSVTMMTIMRLLGENAKINVEKIIFDDKDITKPTEKLMQTIRGNDMSMIFQDPMTSLNPLFTVGDQLTEHLIKHKKISKKEANEKAIKMLDMVGIPSPEKRLKQYPHEFSGGMRQRVMIAMSLICEPKLIIADEPTTALDVTIQAQILDLMKDIKSKLDTSIILITHDLGVVADLCSRINVMYGGLIVEEGTTEDIFYRGRHPYTWGLLSSMPDLTGDKKERLYTIPGNPPNLANEVKGDAFAVRNPYALNIDFEEEPPMFEINEHHQAATWLLHPDAPKVEMPQTLKKRIEQLRREEKRYAETEGAYGTDE